MASLRPLNFGRRTWCPLWELRLGHPPGPLRPHCPPGVPGLTSTSASPPLNPYFVWEILDGARLGLTHTTDSMSWFYVGCSLHTSSWHPRGSWSRDSPLEVMLTITAFLLHNPQPPGNGLTHQRLQGLAELLRYPGPQIHPALSVPQKGTENT